MLIIRAAGQTCVGDLRLSPLDVGFDVRLHGYSVVVPAEVQSAGYDHKGTTYLVEGTRAEIVHTLQRNGYTVAGVDELR